ncbi:MAG: restriction endonuclease subunit S [Serratia liquefaciens]|nr:restriction endonuclease subunit S [Serratia liquefaciens]
MSVDNKVPEIRFKGFSEKWQEREFSNIATRVSTHHQSTCLPCVEYEDIVAGKGRFNKDIHQKKSFKTGLKFEADDVLFGKLRPYLKNWFLADFEGLAVGDFWVLRADNVASTFLFSLIQTNEFELVSNLSAGSKMPRSDWGLVSSSCFFVPKNIYESNEIGHYFQKLDTLINQHQQKHDKLSSIKKAMLEKMFPKQGETIPEIRFKGFTGEWDKKPFGACFVNVPNNTLSRADLNYKTGLAKNIHYGDVLIKFGEVLDARNELLPFITNDSIANKLNNSGLRDGDIIIADAAEDNTVGKCTELFNIGDQLILSGLHTIAVRPIFPFASKYLGYHLNSSSYHDQLLSLMQGTKVLSISKAAIKDTNIAFPKSLEEQAAIGTYFQNLDSLIKQNQQQITKLNNIKQACLSKMFV